MDKLEYVEYNIFEKTEEGEKRRNELVALGVMGVPYIKITYQDDRVEIINGYDLPALENLAKTA
jgi:hypothetical protein